MEAHRLYIDSRDRSSGTATDFEYQLANSIVIEKECTATLDCVLIPNSWYTVTKDSDDGIYIREESAGFGYFRVAILRPGYYDANSLATEIARALTQDSVMASPYTCVYGATLGRYEISNAWTGPEDNLYIWSETGINVKNWGISRSQLHGAFRQIGMVEGPVQLGGEYGTTPLVMNGTPNLQAHSELYIKGSLGSPGLVQGRRGAQDILRRCPITTRSGGLNLTEYTSHYDSIRVPPGTITTLKFRLEGDDGPVDLNGLDWSFSVVIQGRK